MLSLIRGFSDAASEAALPPFSCPAGYTWTSAGCMVASTTEADTNAIANALKAGAGIYTLPQQIQQLQTGQAQALAAQQQANALALMSRGQVPAQSAMPSWLPYAGAAAVDLVLVIALAARK